MKPTRILLIDGKPYSLTEENISLQLNTAGSGILTVVADTALTGKSVDLSVGYNGEVMPWFSGYVENDSPVSANLRKLLIREAAEVLRYPLHISEQHPTLKTIAGIITGKTGISVILPGAEYTLSPVPHIKHSGNGIQLLNMLGRCFSVPDYVWYCVTGGQIYIGSYNDCRFAGKPVNLPVQFINSDSGANGWKIPVIAAVRPGVLLNGNRLQRVRLHGDQMSVYWADNRDPALKKQIETLYPEIGARSHLPGFARVISHTESVQSGQIADPFRPKYAVDLQELDENGNPTDTPVYRAVPLPVPFAGSECGLFQYPHPGTVVELGYINGRPDKPVIRSIHARGLNLPEIRPGEQLQQQRPEVFQRVHQDGSWQRETDQEIREKSAARHIEHHSETRVITERETTVAATDKTTVAGTCQLLAGEIQQLADGNYSLAASEKWLAHAGSAEFDIKNQWHTSCRSWNTETALSVQHRANDISEQITTIKRSVAGALQMLSAPVIQLACSTLQITGATLSVGSSGSTATATIAAGKIRLGDANTRSCDVHGDHVWIGSQTTNTLQLMLDLCDAVQALASATAAHTHTYYTTPPDNSSRISGVAATAAGLKNKYRPLIK